MIKHGNVLCLIRHNSIYSLTSQPFYCGLWLAVIATHLDIKIYPDEYIIAQILFLHIFVCECVLLPTSRKTVCKCVSPVRKDGKEGSSPIEQYEKSMNSLGDSGFIYCKWIIYSQPTLSAVQFLQWYWQLPVTASVSCCLVCNF